MAHSPDSATNYGAGQKTLKSYVIGLSLSLLFTFVAFALVAQHSISTAALYISLSILALLQLFAQVVFFLRFNTSREGRWTLMPFLFVIVIVLVVVGGSLWIMFNLNYNMVH